MNCEEFELALPDVDDDPSIEQQSHLNSCSACAELVADLDAISQQAKLLGNSDEPSQRVWNFIEIALRQEGLIREQKSEPFLVPRRPPRRRLEWLFPVAALVLLMLGIVQYKRTSGPVASRTPNAEMASSQIAEAANMADDQQLLEVVSRRTPTMRASYEANLRDVNSYIRDAEESVKIDPNDEQARRDLMNAYEQRSMVYEMALDRSLP
jgi:hypothetical protein